MTDEEKWLSCPSVGQALQLLNRAAKSVDRGRSRKFRLCACYLLRHLEPETTDERFAHALDVAERHFDGQAPLSELKAAITDAQRGYEVHRNDLEHPDELAAQSLDSLLNDPPRESVGHAFRRSMSWEDEAGEKACIALLQELFGNPFRAVTFSPDWRTDTVLTLARTMHDSRDFTAMPILADALQDAGCDNDDILEHCRDGNQVHVRGCWVCDLVLGKS